MSHHIEKIFLMLQNLAIISNKVLLDLLPKVCIRNVELEDDFNYLTNSENMALLTINDCAHLICV